MNWVNANLSEMRKRDNIWHNKDAIDFIQTVRVSVCTRLISSRRGWNWCEFACHVPILMSFKMHSVVGHVLTLIVPPTYPFRPSTDWIHLNRTINNNCRIRHFWNL